MDERENARFWEENAAEWTRLVRRGFDESRDLVNTPAFLAMLPDVAGRRGLDLGCGEGHNTRLLAARRARMTALDIAPTMLCAAAEAERERAGAAPIRLVRGSGLNLPFADGAFEFVTAFMSVMDMPDHRRVLGEVFRVLAPGGFFQLSLPHPCFQTPLLEWLRDETGRKRAVACGDYYRELDGEIEEWTFGAALRAGVTPERKFRSPRFTHTLSTWLNMFVDAGFALERFDEPTVDEAMVARYPTLYDHRIIAYFLLIRVRKPE
jgi:ubiquinone/menaquinone biosynthesis C-methylase UbiE